MRFVATALIVGAALTSCAADPAPVPVAATTTPTVKPVTTATARPTTPPPTDQVQPEPTATPGTDAMVTIVSYGADGQDVSASGIVTGDAGTDGTCTLVATSDGGDVETGSIDAQSTPSATNCGVVSIAVPSGDWTLVLEYTSAVAEASSDPVKVTQP